jgi:3-methyladenine DNA glycosylase AlkC
MINVLLYYDFFRFFKDESNVFNGNEISYSELNSEHFLIFEKSNENYNLYVSKYNSKNDIGKNKPLLLELVIENYDKSIPEHRIALRRYFE